MLCWLNLRPSACYIAAAGWWIWDPWSWHQPHFWTFLSKICGWAKSELGPGWQGAVLCLGGEFARANLAAAYKFCDIGLLVDCHMIRRRSLLWCVMKGRLQQLLEVHIGNHCAGAQQSKQYQTFKPMREASFQACTRILAHGLNLLMSETKSCVASASKCQIWL